MARNALLLAGLLALTSAPLQAQEAAPSVQSASTLKADWYLSFPHSTTVIGGVDGSFDLHTRARQFAALDILERGMQALNEVRPVDAAGQRFIARREVEFLHTRNTLRALATGDSNWKRKLFTGKSGSLRRDPEYVVEIAQQFLPPDVARQMIVALDAESGLPEGQQPEKKPEPQPTPSTPPPRKEVTFDDIVWMIVWSPLGLIALLGIGFATWLANRNPGAGRPQTSDTYGSARFADVRKMIEPDRAGAGIFLGKSSHPEADPKEAAAPIFTKPETHTLILARSGTGKGTRVIMPTLLRYPDSMIVIDPKGENAAVTARTRSIDLAQTVHILNPWGELAEDYAARGFPRSATFNPLDVLDRADKNAVAIAQAMAGAICGAGEGKDAVWRGSAAQLLAGVFLWLADQPGEEKTLARARHIVTRSRAELDKDYLPRMAASTAFRGAVSELASPFIGMAEETFSGVLFNLAEATRFISDEAIKESTALSSFSMRDLIERRSTVYIVFPSDRMAEASTWLRLILAAVTHTFRRTKRRHDRPRCMFLIDEFPALGRVDSMLRDIAEMRGYGLDFTIIVQGLDQLQHHYGQAGSRTIINNCAYQWYCNVSDNETAKYLSSVLGKKTVATTSTSEGAGGGGATVSTSHGETGRDLLTADEIQHLGRDVAIVVNPEDRPFYLRTVDYWSLAGHFGPLAKNGGMREYFTPAIRFDENPYVRKAKEEEARKQKDKRKKSDAHDGMTRVKALTVLGLKDGATADEIKAAYSRLMKRVHPDQGGTDHFARQLNEARDYLLRAK